MTHTLLVFRKDTIYFPSPNPPNTFSYAYYPGPIPGGYPGTTPTYPTCIQNQNNATDLGTGAGTGTVNETFHLLNEQGLAISSTSPILSTQTQTEKQGKNSIAPLLLVAVTEAMRANKSFSGFEYLTSWMANDYRHYYVILEKAESVNAKNKENENDKNGDSWTASPSSPVNAKDTRDHDTGNTRKENTASKDEGNTTTKNTNDDEWGTTTANANVTTTTKNIDDNEWEANGGTTTNDNDWGTNEGNTTAKSTNDNEWGSPAKDTNDNEWGTANTPSNPNTDSISSPVPASNPNAKDPNTNTFVWSSPSEPNYHIPSTSGSSQSRPFTVRDWARSPSPSNDNGNDNFNTDPNEGASGSVWGDTPSSSW